MIDENMKIIFETFLREQPELDVVKNVQHIRATLGYDAVKYGMDSSDTVACPTVSTQLEDSLIFIATGPDTFPIKTIRDTLNRIPVCNQNPDHLDAMRKQMTSFLEDIRTNSQKDEYQCDNFSITREQVTKTQSRARRLNKDVIHTDVIVHRDDYYDLWNKLQTGRTVLSNDNLHYYYKTSQWTALSGPVYCVYDGNGTSLPIAKHPIHMVSVPAMDFTTATVYSKLLAENYHHRVRGMMRDIWWVALSGFQRAKVKIPVLCALGCSVDFCRSDDLRVPEMWATALAEVLVDPNWEFTAVILAIPENRGHRTIFTNELRKLEILSFPVVVVRDHDTLDVAHALRTVARTGVLNPVHLEAMVFGIDDTTMGRTISEKTVAARTTLMINSIELNPTLWTDPKRAVTLEKKQ